MVACYFGTRDARFTFGTRCVHSTGVQVRLVLTNTPLMWLIATKALHLLGIASIGATTLFFITAYLRIDLANLVVFAVINTILTVVSPGPRRQRTRLRRHRSRRTLKRVRCVIIGVIKVGPRAA
jgi:hypothetical protein